MTEALVPFNPILEFTGYSHHHMAVHVASAWRISRFGHLSQMGLGLTVLLRKMAILYLLIRISVKRTMCFCFIGSLYSK